MKHMNSKTKKYLLWGGVAAAAYWFLVRPKMQQAAAVAGLRGASVAIEQNGLAGAPVYIENVGLSGRFLQVS